MRTSSTFLLIVLCAFLALGCGNRSRSAREAIGGQSDPVAPSVQPAPEARPTDRPAFFLKGEVRRVEERCVYEFDRDGKAAVVGKEGDECYYKGLSYDTLGRVVKYRALERDYIVTYGPGNRVQTVTYSVGDTRKVIFVLTYHYNPQGIVDKVVEVGEETFVTTYGGFVYDDHGNWITRECVTTYPDGNTEEWSDERKIYYY